MMNQWSEVIHRKSEKPIVYSISLSIYIYTGKFLGFARKRNHDRQRIIIIIIIIVIIIKPFLKIFNECRSLTGVGV